MNAVLPEVCLLEKYFWLEATTSRQGLKWDLLKPLKAQHPPQLGVEVGVGVGYEVRP